MIAREPPPPRPPTPQSLDQRIVVVRQDLESAFTELETVLDVCLTIHEALEHQNCTHDIDFAHVLQRCASDPLYRQLLELTTIIEALGGTTSYSDEDRIDAQVAEVLGGGQEEGGNHE